jgi:hypothetical protein
VVEFPAQILAVLGETEIVKLGAIETEAVAIPVQVPVAPNTVYVVLMVGLAVTLDPLAELNDAEGVQV